MLFWLLDMELKMAEITGVIVELALDDSSSPEDDLRPRRKIPGLGTRPLGRRGIGDGFLSMLLSRASLFKLGQREGFSRMKFYLVLSNTRSSG